MIKNKIVLVPFPFDDLSGRKLRPAVCLSEKINPYNHVIVAFITSKIPADISDSDVILNTEHPEFKKTIMSVILCKKEIFLKNLINILICSIILTISCEKQEEIYLVKS